LIPIKFYEWWFGDAISYEKYLQVGTETPGEQFRLKSPVIKY